MLLCGSAAFKVARLVVSAVLIVHVFACGFYRVKAESAGHEALADFFVSRGVSPQVAARKQGRGAVASRCISRAAAMVCRADCRSGWWHVRSRMCGMTLRLNI